MTAIQLAFSITQAAANSVDASGDSTEWFRSWLSYWIGACEAEIGHDEMLTMIRAMADTLQRRGPVLMAKTH